MSIGKRKNFIKVLGIIPARGGSKGLPGKNIKLLAGKPLIAWTIKAALESHMLDRVIVSTDDPKIAKISRKWGAETPFLRPKQLARDRTRSLPVLKHAISFLKHKEGYIPDVVVLLQPTSPLRKPKHIRQALSLFHRTKANSLVGVCRAEHSPYWMMRLKGTQSFPLMADSKKYERRQDCPPVYRVNGAMYVTGYHVLMTKDKIMDKNARAFVMDAHSSIDIDTPLDFKMAEILMKERKLGRH